MNPIRSFRGRTPRLGQNAWVDPTALLIGDVVLGAESSVWPQCCLRGDIHHIRIGERTNIQDGSVVHVIHDSEYVPGGHGVTVGDEVTVGHQVTLHGCAIGDRCLVGMGSIILDGAELEAEVLLGAGSLVTPGQQLDGGYLWLGSPARRVRPLISDERDYLRYSAHNYVKLAQEHAASLR